MNRRLVLSALLASTLVAAGCASGPKYTEVATSFPTIKAGEGRIYFFRSTAFGAALKPDVRLNDVVIGVSEANGFFYVDRPAGNYKAAASTETEKTLTFTLAAGETKYVRMAPSLGLLVGRINLELETPEKAREDLQSLAYTGVKPPAK